MDRAQSIESAVGAFQDRTHEFRIFMNGAAQWFEQHPRLSAVPPVVHSVKSRLKNCDHLRDKLQRKWDETNPIDGSNVFGRVTDLAGVRVLHLHQEQFALIHGEIRQKVEKLRDWYLPEPPKAYTWDPESRQFFEGLGVGVQLKETFYTSVHYLIKPRQDSPICCELQVRTLFEEIWGEVDHTLNYPNPIGIASCREQILVLAKLVGAGSRLVDSIFRSSQNQGQSAVDFPEV